MCKMELKPTSDFDMRIDPFSTAIEDLKEVKPIYPYNVGDTKEEARNCKLNT